MCSSSPDEPSACWALQAQSSGVGRRERDRRAMFTHPSPATSCCREGRWRGARPPGSQQLSFPPQICCRLPQHSPHQHFLQLSDLRSRRDMAHSQFLALSKSCWTAVPSIGHSSGAEGCQQHTAHVPCCLPSPHFCRNTLGQRCTAPVPTPALYK